MTKRNSWEGFVPGVSFQPARDRCQDPELIAARKALFGDSWNDSHDPSDHIIAALQQTGQPRRQAEHTAGAFRRIVSLVRSKIRTPDYAHVRASAVIKRAEGTQTEKKGKKNGI